MQRTLTKVIIAALLLSGFIYSQPKLKITPDEIEYEDVFHRLQNVYFINEGDLPLVIDSISYIKDFYFVRFDVPWTFPIYINPGDSVKMDCILADFYYIPSYDSTNWMYVYNNGGSGTQGLKIKIDYYDLVHKEGIIQGQITDGSAPVGNTSVHFFYEGNYLIKQTETDQWGYYTASLPPGLYTVAAEKDSYYVSYFGQQFSPLNANFIKLEDDSVKTANINLIKKEPSSISIKGFVRDKITGMVLRKGRLIIRRGRHNPSKIRINDSGSAAEQDVYTALIKPDGSYLIDNIINPDSFYIQSFSDYFVPSYYNTDASTQFWQQATPVYINSNLTDMDIYMPRDSSVGGGSAQGTISINTATGDTLYDVLVYAQSLNGSDHFVNYTFTSQTGEFKISFLPYGSYRMVAQKIGYKDAYSSGFTISPEDTLITGLNITLNPVSSVEDPFVPGEIILYQNYPNPFNPATTIEFYLPSDMFVTLRVTNILGEEVEILYNDFLRSGLQKIIFNGDGLSSGTYFISLISERGTQVRKILLLK
jgi:hypothetical protein